MSADNPEIQKPADRIFEADLHGEVLSFNPDYMGPEQTAVYADVDPNNLHILAGLDCGSPDNRFVIVKDDETDEGKSPYGIFHAMPRGKDENGKTTYIPTSGKAVVPGEPVALGREAIDGSHLTHTDELMSRKHATIEINEFGSVKIEDHSTNGTHIRYADTSGQGGVKRATDAPTEFPETYKLQSIKKVAPQ